MLQEFFNIVENLKTIPRQGWKDKLGIKSPESVADHCYSMTTMAMVLADLQKLDTEKILKMSLLHDLAESLTGDFTPKKLSKKEKQKIEDKEMKKILSYLPRDLKSKYFTIWEEYKENKTKVAILVHEVDKLEMAFQANIYAKDGHSLKKIKTFTDSAKSGIKSKELFEILNKLLHQS